MMSFNWKIFGVVVGLLAAAGAAVSSDVLPGEGTADAALQKIEVLNQLIGKAERAGIDPLKEKMTVRTAEVFLKYADWDAAHPAKNVSLFEQTKIYKDDAGHLAEILPAFERKEVALMLDSAADTLRDLLAGTMTRKATPAVDWSKVTLDGNQLTYKERPVFLTDWTWKPGTPELTEFFGQQDGFFLTHSYVQNERGDINPRIERELKEKGDGSLGFIFLNHKSAPKWAREKYGPGYAMRADTYTAYDIDNPGAREINRLLLAGTVPYMAGKKFSQLGYMLCNEPHFYTTEGVWATGPVSHFTLDKFRVWLKHRHHTIAALNGLWGTSFADFDAVQFTVPVSSALQGTPQWFDWVSFNMDRVTDWYRFLKSEICKYDPSAKVHLKIMPNLWTDNKRNHGIDVEALTRMSGIIGNDAGAVYRLSWGKDEWQKHYAFEWREMSMGHDFFKSVSPDKIMYNTESHFLSTVRSRDLYMDPRYARATFWLATTQGLNVSQNWFWARRADGSMRSSDEKGYAGSNNQQPRVVNEVQSTLMDLNSYAEEITAMQRQKKPIRIFYTKASAFNKPKHMDDLFELYEALNFEGIPLGFVTQGILANEDSSNWDVILVHKTQFATVEEIQALQDYIDAGGTVVVDGVSLKNDEYGRSLQGLTGAVIQTGSLAEMKAAALQVVAQKGSAPAVSVAETNTDGPRGCTWKCIENSEGNQVLSIVNVGKTQASLVLKLTAPGAKTVCKNILTGQTIGSTPVLQPYDVLFVEVSDGNVR